jgi:hypothetical protein
MTDPCMFIIVICCFFSLVTSPKKLLFVLGRRGLVLMLVVVACREMATPLCKPANITNERSGNGNGTGWFGRDEKIPDDAAFVFVPWNIVFHTTGAVGSPPAS